MKNNLFQRHPKSTLIIFVLFCTITVDVTAKNALKLYTKRMLRSSDHETEYRIASEYFHHTLKPLTTIPRTVWGHKFHSVATNSLGFRDQTARTVSPGSERHRIVFIGDSFTEGIGVDYDKTFVGIIDDELKHRQIEVLNAAVASYSPAIYYAKIHHMIAREHLRFDSLVVFLDISDIWDEASTYRLTPDLRVVTDADAQAKSEAREAEFVRRFKTDRPLYYTLERILKRDSILLYHLVKACHDALFSRPLIYDYDGLSIYKSLWTVDDRLYEAYGREGLKSAADNMDRLLDLCDRHRIDMTLAVYPWPDQIHHNEVNSRQATFWKAWAEARGVPVIDFFPAMIPAPHTSEAVRHELDTYYISGDSHWNEAGHRRIAEIFMNHYEPLQRKEDAQRASADRY